MLHIGGICGLICLGFAPVISAIDVDFTNQDSIKAAASKVAYRMMTYYHGNTTGGTPGILNWPDYYWWEAGAMWGTLIDYWRYTGDTSYNQVVMDALQFQVGPDKDFMPPNQTFSMGNDDQAFWAMASLAAAEYNFPNPPAGKPSWLGLAQAVFNEQISRWDTTTCGGGIHWQVYQANGGYNLKNTISNGCLFNIASRLARYTGDSIYSDWAVKVWDWMWAIGLIDENYNVYDNSEAMVHNCSGVDHTQWSYNAATLLMGASTMYNYTDGDQLWKTRMEGLLSTITYDYFPGGVMKEICDEYLACNTDQKSFKAYLSRWMTATTHMAPYTYNNITNLLISSAKGAAAQCIGGTTGDLCGVRWYTNGTWDGTSGVGQQMSVLAVLVGTLVEQGATTQVPLTNATGGTSAADPTAGTNTTTSSTSWMIAPATSKGRVGAWFLTAFIALMAIIVTGFMISEALERGDSTVKGRRRRMTGTQGTVAGFVGWKGKEKEVSASGANGSGNGEDISAQTTTEEADAVADIRGSRRFSNSPVSLDNRRSFTGVLPPKRSHLSMVSMPPGDREVMDGIGAGERVRSGVPIYRGGDLAT